MGESIDPTRDALRAILLDQRRAALAVVERTEAALAMLGRPVQSAIRPRGDRRRKIDASEGR